MYLLSCNITCSFDFHQKSLPLSPCLNMWSFKSTMVDWCWDWTKVFFSNQQMYCVKQHTLQNSVSLARTCLAHTLSYISILVEHPLRFKQVLSSPGKKQCWLIHACTMTKRQKGSNAQLILHVTDKIMTTSQDSTLTEVPPTRGNRKDNLCFDYWERCFRVFLDKTNKYL